MKAKKKDLQEIPEAPSQVKAIIPNKAARREMWDLLPEDSHLWIKKKDWMQVTRTYIKRGLEVTKKLYRKEG